MPKLRIALFAALALGVLSLAVAVATAKRAPVLSALREAGAGEARRAPGIQQLRV